MRFVIVLFSVGVGIELLERWGLRVELENSVGFSVFRGFGVGR